MLLNKLLTYGFGNLCQKIKIFLANGIFFLTGLIVKCMKVFRLHCLCLGLVALSAVSMRAKEIKVTFDAGKYQKGEDWGNFIADLCKTLRNCTKNYPQPADIHLTVNNGGLFAFCPQEIQKNAEVKNIISNVKELKIIGITQFNTDALRHVFTETQVLNLPDVSIFLSTPDMNKFSPSTLVENVRLESVSAPKVHTFATQSFCYFRGLKHFNDSGKNAELRDQSMSFVAFVPEEDFFSKSEVTKDTLPNPQAGGVKIGEQAFYGCGNLRSVVAKCLCLGDAAFAACAKLECGYLLVLSNGLLRGRVFRQCWNLKECLLMSEEFNLENKEYNEGNPNCVGGERMFEDCFLLETLGIPNLSFHLYPKETQTWTFGQCFHMTNLDLRSQNHSYDLIADCLNTCNNWECIESSITGIGDSDRQTLLQKIKERQSEIEECLDEEDDVSTDEEDDVSDTDEEDDVSDTDGEQERYDVYCLIKRLIVNKDLYEEHGRPRFRPDAETVEALPVFDASQKSALPYPETSGVLAFRRFNSIYKRCFRNPAFGESEITKKETGKGGVFEKEKEKEKEEKPKNEMLGKKVERTNFYLHGG